MESTLAINFKKATDPNFSAYAAIGVQFSIYSSPSKKLYLGLGWGGDNLPVLLDSVGIAYGEWDGSNWINQKSKNYSFNWSINQTHKATLEKNGNLYKLYLNDVYLGEWVDTYLNGQGKVGLHTYGPKLLDNFVIYK